MASMSSKGAVSGNGWSNKGSLPQVGVEEPVETEALVLGDQQLRVFMLWVVQDLAGRAVLNHGAGPHHEYLVAELCDDRQVMGDEHEREPLGLLQLLQQVQDLGLHGNVQGGRRFVGDED